MKTIQICIGLFFLSTHLHAQQLVTKIDNSKIIEIHDIYGDLTIIGNNSDELNIKILGQNEIPNGITNYQPNNYETDNTQLGLHVKNQQDVLSIHASNKKAQFSDYEIEIPKNLLLKIDNKFMSVTNDDKVLIAGLVSEMTIKRMKNEIDINVFASDMKINNVTGPLVVSAYKGSCNFNFEKYNQDNPSTINMIEGDIKVNFMFDTKAHVTLKSGTSEINTNFVFRDVTLEFDKQTLTKKKFGGSVFDKNDYTLIKGDINKGGNSITISTLNGKVEFYQYGNPVFVNPVVVSP